MKEINTDFQGGPVNALTLKELLQALGAKMCVSEDCKCAIIGFEDNDPRLDLYPVTLEDDGMGYGVNPQFITDVSEANEKLYFFLCPEKTK